MEFHRIGIKMINNECVEYKILFSLGINFCFIHWWPFISKKWSYSEIFNIAKSVKYKSLWKAKKSKSAKLKFSKNEVIYSIYSSEMFLLTKLHIPKISIQRLENWMW